MAAAWTPPRSSCLASRSAPCLVRTKNSVRAGRGRRSGSATATLSSRCDVNDPVRPCVDRRLVSGRRACSGRVGAGTCSTSVSTPRSRVAENSSRWPSGRRLLEEPRDDGQEAEVGHVVGLVEHGDLDVVEGAAPCARCRSTSRPGVATTMSTPRCRARDLAADRRAAEDGRRRARRAAWPSGARASATCWASSRVGTRTRPRGAVGAGTPARGQPGEQRQAEGQRLAGAGLAPAEHVAAGQGVGQGAAWMAKGCVMPRRASAVTSAAAGRTRRSR